MTTTSSSSSSSLFSSSSKEALLPPQKDYAAALAALQSSLGASGAAPRLPFADITSTSKTSKPKSKPPVRTKKVQPVLAAGQKDYTAGLAALQSSLGASGAAPRLPFADITSTASRKTSKLASQLKKVESEKVGEEPVLTRPHGLKTLMKKLGRGGREGLL